MNKEMSFFLQKKKRVCRDNKSKSRVEVHPNPPYTVFHHPLVLSVASFSIFREMIINLVVICIGGALYLCEKSLYLEQHAPLCSLFYFPPNIFEIFNFNNLKEYKKKVCCRCEMQLFKALETKITYLYLKCDNMWYFGLFQHIIFNHFGTLVDSMK